MGGELIVLDWIRRMREVKSLTEHPTKDHSGCYRDTFPSLTCRVSTASANTDEALTDTHSHRSYDSVNPCS